MQAQGGGDDQAQQQGQVAQMKEEVVGLLPLLTQGGVGLYSRDSRSGRGKGGQGGEEEWGQLWSRGHS